MKTGRNDLCPCGSGKKYKKCCYQSNIIPFPGNINEKQENFTRSMVNVHKGLLHNKPHIREYNKYRQLHGEVMNKLVDYFQDGNYDFQFDNDSIKFHGNRKSSDFIGCNFNTETQENAQAFYDLMIYKNFQNKNCIIEEFISKNIFRNQDKINLMQNMLNSKLGLFEITKINQGEGLVYFKNVFTGEEIKITDMGLSCQLHFDEFYLYMRIISHNGINFGSGFILIIKKTDKFINDFIQEQKKDFNPDDEIVRFMQLYKHYSNDKNRVRPVYS